MTQPSSAEVTPAPETEPRPRAKSSRWVARRPMKLLGKQYQSGDRIPASVIAALPRPEALLHVGFATKE